MTDPRQAMIKKMRADFLVIADARRKWGDWSEADEQECGAAIKEAIAAGDADNMTQWAVWLSDLAHTITTMAVLVRNSEARMRERSRQAREAREQAAQAKRERRPSA